MNADQSGRTWRVRSWAVAGLALMLAAIAGLWQVSRGARPPAIGPLWLLLSSTSGDLETPGGAPEQTAALIADLDGDGINDFVIGARAGSPAIVWYHRRVIGWDRYVIEPASLPIEAGGALGDIDNDGDLDVVMGEDRHGSHLYWWENPRPLHDPRTAWTRREIKSDGPAKHHDQVFADIDGDGEDELVFWNQGAGALFWSDVPAEPNNSPSWGRAALWTSDERKAEGLAAGDLDGDGLVDLVAAGTMLRHRRGSSFVAEPIDSTMASSRAAVGQLVEGGWPEVVLSSAESEGPARWYEWTEGTWVSHELVDDAVVNAHSLAIGDVDLDGHQDVFMAEMRTSRYVLPTAWIMFGDGRGGFRREIVSTGLEHHESRLADLDGDGDLDLLAKPYKWRTPGVDVLLNQRAPLDRWVRHVIDPDRRARSLFVDAADLDGDGRSDVVSGRWWYRNPGDLASPWSRSAIGEPLLNMALLHDLDGDGDVDVLGTRGAGSQPDARFVWAANDGHGAFTVSADVARGSGDFLQGVAVGQFAGPTPEVALSWHKGGNGIELLSPAGLPGHGEWPVGLASDVSQHEALSAGDVDGDGRVDLVLGTRWLQNTETGWREHVLDRAEAPDRSTLADIDGDGWLDVIVGFEAPSVPADLVWYRNPGSNRATGLWDRRPIATLIGPMSLDGGDIDGDGDIDLVVGEHNKKLPASARLFVLENRNAGREWISHLVHKGDEHHDGAVLVDIDGDEDLDILSIGWTHNRTLLYENRMGHGQFVERH